MRCHRPGGGPFLGRVRRTVQLRPGRSLLQRPVAFQAGLFVGRPDQPGGALRHRADARSGRGDMAAQGNAGALLDRPRRRRGPARRPRAGAFDALNRAGYRLQSTHAQSLGLPRSKEKQWQHQITATRSARKNWPRKRRRKRSSGTRPTAS
ncbi:hypothetical protein VARIO8X_90536 [Burkholderiales bacterium 8X]|nr:hypothetical protein VARIO8X_90536 [Burkholderiales bacterium 8X]